MQNRTSGRAVAAALAGALILAIASGAAQGPSFAEAPARKQSNAAAPRTVLDGIFSEAQAERGAALYGSHCAACHDGADVDGPPLTGAPFIDRWREEPLAGLFEFIKAGMPQSAPGSLSDTAYLDIVAHMLHENSYPAGSSELTAGALPTTLLVGPNGPQPLPNGALVRVAGCLAQSPSREWSITRAQRPSRVREGKQITPAEAAAAKGAGLGTQTFALQNVGEGGTTLPAGGAEGQLLLVKGALTQRAGAGRIHVTAATSLATTCD